jgi:hypothetical protein
MSPKKNVCYLADELTKAVGSFKLNRYSNEIALIDAPPVYSSAKIERLPGLLVSQ